MHGQDVFNVIKSPDFVNVGLCLSTFLTEKKRGRAESVCARRADAALDKRAGAITVKKNPKPTGKVEGKVMPLGARHFWKACGESLQMITLAPDQIWWIYRIW